MTRLMSLHKGRKILSENTCSFEQGIEILINPLHVQYIIEEIIYESPFTTVLVLQSGDRIRVFESIEDASIEWKDAFN